MLTVTSVTLLGGFGLRLEFSDGVTGDVDCSFLLDQGLGTALRDAEHFRQVAIDTELGTVVWPNDLDPAPSVMRSHAEISAVSSRPLATSTGVARSVGSSPINAPSRSGARLPLLAKPAPVLRDTLRGPMHSDSGIRTRRTVSRLTGTVLLGSVLVSATAGVASGMVAGQTVPITAAPWSVVVRRAGLFACTGVIIDPLRILTAGHCVMSGTSAKPLPASAFRIEAGVSNFKHPLKSDHPQFRSVSAVWAMPGYIATSHWKSHGTGDTSHDLAVLTLSRPLDLSGDDARAANLPNTHTREPPGNTRLVMAGFGDEKPTGYYTNGTLNEVTKATVDSCGTNSVLCITSTRTGICFGDSGSGAVEPGPRPTVVGVMSSTEDICGPYGIDSYASLTTPAALRFIKTGT